MKSILLLRMPQHAATLLAHPTRTRILARARIPISASDLARELGQPRQRINYHVRKLAAAGFLNSVAQQKKRNMLEQQYVASARAYVLSPEVLGDVAPDAGEQGDAASAGHLVAMCSRAQSEVALVMDAADAAGLRVRTTAIESELRFETAAQRAEFTRALTEAVSDVVAQHATRSAGRPFRLVLGCYPIA